MDNNTPGNQGQEPIVPAGSIIPPGEITVGPGEAADPMPTPEPVPTPEPTPVTTPPDVMKIIADLQEQVAILTQVADKGRMATIDDRRPKKVDQIVNVSTIGGLVVVAWRTDRDEVYKDENGVWHEDQVVVLTTEDDKEHVMTLVDRIREIRKVPATIISRMRDNDGSDGEELHEIFKLRLESGREITLDGRFIN